MKTSQPYLLLDLIIAKEIQGLAEKAIRYQQINSYDDLYEALKQNLGQTSSILALKSKLESCKQGLTETVQNLTLRFRQIVNEINYAIQSQHINPIERRLKMKLEEQEAVNRYLLNLKKEIGIQIRLLKPTIITQAQSHAVETEMWMRESQPTRITTPKTVITSKFNEPQVFRPSANTTSNRIPNEIESAFTR